MKSLNKFGERAYFIFNVCVVFVAPFMIFGIFVGGNNFIDFIFNLYALLALIILSFGVESENEDYRKMHETLKFLLENDSINDYSISKEVKVLIDEIEINKK